MASVKDVNLETITDMQLLEPTGKPKVIHTDNSLEYGRACEDLSWNHCTSTPHRSKTNGLLRLQYAELKKGHLLYCCNQVWVKIGGWFSWNATAICETLKTGCVIGNHRSKGDLANHLEERSFNSDHWLNIILYPRKTRPESINLERKYSLKYSSVMDCTQRRIWKGDMLVVDLEELEG